MSPADIGAIAALPDSQDREALLDTVHRFAGAAIAPVVQRPESPGGPDTVDGILAELTELGVLTGAGEPGLGVWDLPTEPLSCRLSMDVIAQVAQVSPGIGYALHLRAVAGWLDRAASLTETGTAVSFDRLGATGGGAVSRALTDRPLSDDDIAVLENAWGASTAGHPQLVVETDTWCHLWWPQWTVEDGWHLVRMPRADLRCTNLAHPHGLDELAYQSCHRIEAVDGDRDAVLGPEHVVEAWAVHGMGLLVIAASAARRAVSRARDYSLTRRQGGQLIGTHDAVAQLLGRSEQTLATTRAVLEHLAGLSAGVSRLHQVWRARAQLHPLLTAAGSDALQVFGGVGYMRDVGAEKDIRDLNTVRRLGGSPAELTLRCAAVDAFPGVAL